MTRLSTYEQTQIERLEAMSVKEARKALSEKEFGDIGSTNHSFCSSWLSVKESEIRDELESKTLRWARHAAYAAYAAAIIATISITITIFINISTPSPL